MSEDTKTTKIMASAETPKNPKRVESGEKLGAMSKQAKKKKASEAKDSEVEFCYPNVDPLTAVGVVGIIGVVAYYGFLSKKLSLRKRSKQTARTTQ